VHGHRASASPSPKGRAVWQPVTLRSARRQRTRCSHHGGVRWLASRSHCPSLAGSPSFLPCSSFSPCRALRQRDRDLAPYAADLEAAIQHLSLRAGGHLAFDGLCHASEPVAEGRRPLEDTWTSTACPRRREGERVSSDGTAIFDCETGEQASFSRLE
jgi:hypothetical protein